MSARSDAPGGPMRILVVNWLDRENPRSGGAETHMHAVFGRLAARGHEVSALVSGFPGGAPRARLDGIDVHRCASRYTFSFAAPRYYGRHLAKGGFDVLVEDLNKVPLFSPFWSRTSVVLLVHHLFGGAAFQAGPAPVAAATWLLERPLARVYGGLPVISVSPSTKRDLVERGLDADRIEVVPNGVDVDFFTPDAALRAERPTLVFLGRLKEYKRVDLLVDAVAALARAGTDVQLLVAGEGDQRPVIESRVREMDVADRVRMLGFLDELEKRRLLRTAWVHVLTSTKEGWGISNLEAAACGTPTVASDSPGLRDSVVDGRTGLLVPHGDADALEGALRRILLDGELRTALGRGAREFAEGFSWDAAASATEALLARVVAGGGRE